MSSRNSDGETLSTLVDVVLRVAQMHGSTVALSDLMQLVPHGMTTDQVSNAFEVSPDLSERYTLKDGFVVSRSGPHPPLDEYARRHEHSTINVRTARWFTARLGKGEAQMIAVSGSTSYKAASWKDDVDLFCITRAEKMWLFLAKALLLARVSQISGRSKVPTCLSCVMDDRHARSLFSADRGALFARDALIAQVILGDGEYESLLATAPWMGKYFPKLYEARRSSRSPLATRAPPSTWDRFVNLFLFATLGSYIATKTGLHNRFLARRGKEQAIFHTRAGTDHLIYESARYVQLRNIYGSLRPAPESHIRQSTGGELVSLVPDEREAR